MFSDTKIKFLWGKQYEDKWPMPFITLIEDSAVASDTNGHIYYAIVELYLTLFQDWSFDKFILWQI